MTANRTVQLEGRDRVKVIWSRDLPSEPTSVTIIKEPGDRYFATFVVQREGARLPDAGRSLGIDLGLATFAADSDGRKIEPLNAYRRAEHRLAHAQRELSRKAKGSNNYDKTSLRLARLHRKVADTRSAFLHEHSTAIIRENQTVVIETLGIKGMSRGRLGKSIHDAG